MFESCTRNFSSLRNPHSRVPKFVFGGRESLMVAHLQPNSQPSTSLTPVPSPNGEGREHC